jgi:outer membrane protein assembly factor BamB
MVRLATVTAVAVMGLAPAAAGSAMPLSSVRTAQPGQRAASGTAAWPQFHYDPAHTGYNPAETTIGPGNVGGLRVLWVRQTGQGSSFSSVSVADGRVFLGTLRDSTLRAWRASSGRLVWRAVTSGGLETTAAVGGGRVFIESNGGVLYGFNARTGALLWSQTIGGGATSPTLAAGVVYAAGNATMNAFSAATGALLWSTPLPGVVRSVPAIAGGRVYVSDEANTALVALDAATGAVLWSKQIRSGSVQLASPVVGDGQVYLCTDAGLYAFGAQTGHRRWSEPDGCADNTIEASNATPALAQGVLYTDAAGQTWAFSASTGALLWSASGGGDGPPAVANGVLYVTTSTGTIQAYDVATHALLWTSPQTGSGESGPAVAGGVLYAGGGNGVYAFAPPGSAGQPAGP